MVKIFYNGKQIGSLVTNHSMTDEEVCEACGIELCVTEEEWVEDKNYFLEDLEIVWE